VNPNYPKVLSAVETLDRILAGASVSRYGDGELRLAAESGRAVSQDPDKDLRTELRKILIGPTHSLVCIPRQGVGPKADRWIKFTSDNFVKYLKQPEYGSAFITRPDSEPEIDTLQYWYKCREIWRNRDVVLVMGTDRGSLDENMLRDARNLRIVWGPRRDAFADIRRIEDEIGSHSAHKGPVIMCLGAAATCLAERLAKKGVWALDLGHMGKFMPKHFR
jgi:hypothetical protein